ncbi:MAG: S8 family peptidase, partial [Pirellulaceae bacterium]
MLSAAPFELPASPSPAWFETVSSPTNDYRLIGSISGASLGSDSSSDLLGKVDTAHWIVQLTGEALEQFHSPAEVVGAFTGSDIDIRVLRGLGLPGQILIGTGCAGFSEIQEVLAGNTYLRSYEPDAVHIASAIPDDPKFELQHGLHNTGQSGGVVDADIDAPEAWEITTGSRDVVVAVIDSGIDYTHPDLAANIWTNPGEIAGNSLDDDNNGFIDDVHGWDFHNNDADPMDDNGHGTHVAGTIGALGNNGLGVTGVVQTVSLMALKFLDKANVGFMSNAVSALNYMTMMHNTYDTNILVSNNSWVTDDASVALYHSVQATSEAEILLVAAAGNGWLRGQNIDYDPYFPASYNLPNIISVAASDQYNRLARFSNYGPETVHIAAPGVSVYSTYPALPDHNHYGSDSGTSMAAPHVTGTAALVWSNLPDATLHEVKEAILKGSDSLPGLVNKVQEGHRLNALGALTTDTYHPRVSATPPENITTPGGETHPLTVSYHDNHNIVHSTID